MSTFGERKYKEQPDIAFNRTPVENALYSNDGKASIVLGGDRNKAADSGYSGLGFGDSSAVDIVCGRGKTIAADQKQNATSINPDFFADAARIYISEKSDIDKYFKLANGKIGNSIGKSAIALKADAIRLIGVEGVKIVTRANPTNSRGEEPGVKGIELIAGNDDSYLQPMVLGNNLVNCINDVTEELSNVKSQVHSVMEFLSNFIDNYTNHVHPPLTGQISPNAQAMKILFPYENIQHTSEDNSSSDNIVSIRNKYLKLPTNLNTYILSQYNKTN